MLFKREESREMWGTLEEKVDYHHKQGSRGGEEKKFNFTTLTVVIAVSHIEARWQHSLRFDCQEITNYAYFHDSAFLFINTDNKA